MSYHRVPIVDVEDDDEEGVELMERGQQKVDSSVSNTDATPFANPSAPPLGEHKRPIMSSPGDMSSSSIQTTTTTDGVICINCGGEDSSSDNSDCDNDTAATKTGSAAGILNLTVMRIGQPSLCVRAPGTTTVGVCKQALFAQEIQNNKRIRFISMGKILADDSKTLAFYNVEDDAVLHCAVSERRDNNNNGNENGVEGGQVNRDEQAEQNLQAMYDSPWLVTPPREGNAADFVLGFVMGFILGILSLIWLWSRMVSRKQKMGIVAGIIGRMFLSYSTSSASSN